MRDRRYLYVALSFWAVATVALIALITGCGDNWRYPTETPVDTRTRTPVHQIAVTNADLLDEGDLAWVDVMWGEAVSCYGVILDGSLLTIEVMPVHECWWSARHGFDVCGMYDYTVKTIVTSMSLRYLPEEMAHYIEFELGMSNPWEDWDKMHKRMNKRAKKCGTRWWNAAGMVSVIP